MSSSERDATRPGPAPAARGTRSVARRGLASVLVAVGAVGAVGAAGASAAAPARAPVGSPAGTTVGADAGTWSVETAPNALAPYGALPGVSCPTTSFCAAVGVGEQLSGNQRVLFETWNGSSWSLEPAPAIKDSASGYLTMPAVACASPTMCMVVGANGANGALKPVVETFDGTSWSAGTPTATDAVSAFSAVSCPSVSSCVAVGYKGNLSGSSAVLVETFNGSTWTIQSAPEPTGSTDASLDGVSCLSAASCVAVGSSYHKGVTSTLAETWDGTAWTVATTPDPSTAYNQLNEVSCHAATDCTAVGFEEGLPADLTLAEHWDGTSWSLMTTPNPTGAQSVELAGVSCPAAGACTAVGATEAKSGLSSTLAETWNGTAWTIATTPDPSAAGDELEAVSCGAAADCVAVGRQTDAKAGGQLITLSAVRSGATWTAPATPDPSGPAATGLSAVTCTSASACVAVGSVAYGTGSARAFADVEVSTGASWKSYLPDSSTTETSELVAVSCAPGTTTSCAAVGQRQKPGTDYRALAVAWNGVKWSTEPVPEPVSGLVQAALVGVSCPAAGSCTAVGNYSGHAGTGLYVATLSGGSWSVATLPEFDGVPSSFDGVSCPSVGACVAVGTSTDGAFSESLAGGTWTATALVTPAGDTVPKMSGVSCTTTTSCTAVGSADTTGGPTVTVAEGWNGTAWGVQATPGFGSATDAFLEGVSCTAAGCEAVGVSNNTTGSYRYSIVAMAWDGTTWTIQSLPVPAHSVDNSLGAVSCTAADTCTVTGRTESANGLGLTLVEAEIP